MKLLAFLAISCSAFAVENNAYIFQAYDDNLHLNYFMYYNNHYYVLNGIQHDFECPCRKR